VTAVLIVIIIVVVLLLIVAGVLISAKNKFATQWNTVQESWRQIDVELERRHTVIGNLVETVKASARFEQNTLNQIVAARSQAMSARGHGAMMQSQAEQQLNGSLNHFFQVAENYPDLKSNQDFRYLQTQMTECEDRIAAGRRFYNGNVKAYNTRFDTWPSSSMKGSYQKADYFQVDDPVVRQAPSMRGAFDDLNSQQQPQQQQLPPQQQFQGQPFQQPQQGYQQQPQQQPQGQPQQNQAPQQVPPQQGQGYPQQPPQQG
jgi:LemA protein